MTASTDNLHALVNCSHFHRGFSRRPRRRRRPLCQSFRKRYARFGLIDTGARISVREKRRTNPVGSGGSNVPIRPIVMTVGRSTVETQSGSANPRRGAQDASRGIFAHPAQNN